MSSSSGSSSGSGSSSSNGSRNGDKKENVEEVAAPVEEAPVKQAPEPPQLNFSM